MSLKVSSAKWQPFCLGLNVWKVWDNIRYNIDPIFFRFVRNPTMQEKGWI